MTRTSHDDELLARLLEKLIAQHKSGEEEGLGECCQEHPELADRLRDLLPMMLVMEQHKPRNDFASASARFSESFPKIGDYQILREINRGGMGIVYEAMQLSLGRHVALKVMSQHLVRHPSAIERFRREARSAARLHHSNIVPVFEVGQDGDVCFYAMQFIQGQALDEVITELRRMGHVRPENESSVFQQLQSSAPSLVDSLLNCDGFGAGSASLSNANDSCFVKISQPTGSQPEPGPDNNSESESSNSVRGMQGKNANTSTASSKPESHSPATTSWGDGTQYYRNVAHIARQIADALQYAHGKNVIHRDIKPSNVLLDAFGTAWVTDFGLAKYEEATDQQFRNNPLTLSGDIVGTLRYMAPERLKGSHDPRTDVYGLGITLYELATLSPAFSLLQRAELLEQVTRQQPSPPRKVNSRVPRDLETIVLKAIEKEPTRRYDSAAAMSEDLRRFLANEPVLARRVGPVGRFQLWFRRNRWAAAATLLSVMCLLILTFGSLAASLVFRTQRDRAVGLRTELEDSSVELKAKSWESHLTAARGLRLSRTHGQRFAALREIQSACELPIPPGHAIDELRTEAIGALCLPDFEVAHQWNYPPDSKIVGFDRWLSRYALSDSSGAVSVLGVEDQKVQFCLSSIGEMSEYGSVVFANDDVTIAQYSGRQLRVFRIIDGSARMNLECKDVLSFDFDFSGSRIAIASALNAIEIRDTNNGKLERKFELAGTPDGSWVRWNPKRNSLAFGSQLLNIDSGELQSIDVAFRRIKMTAWDPAGQILAIINDLDEILFWDIDRQQCWPAIQLVGGRGMIATFNSLGNRLLCTNWNHTWMLFDVSSGSPLMTMRAGQAWLRFTPDDRMAGADVWAGECRLYRFANGREQSGLNIVRKDSERQVGLIYGRPVLSGDEQWLLQGYSHGASRLMEVKPGLQSFPFEIPGRPVGFDRQGGFLTIGELGLLRWPVTQGDEGQRKIGPPQQLAMLSHAENPSFNPANGMLVFPRYGDPTLVGRIDEKGYQEVRTLGPQRDVRSTTISPDGNWLVTGSHGEGSGSGCKIWNSKDGKLVAELPVVFAGRSQFSPDGAWMLTPGIRPQLWRTGNWTEGPTLNAIAQSGAGCFSSDSNFLVLEDEPDYVRIYRTNDGEEIAKVALPVSPSSRLWPVKLTESGQLILVGVDNDTVYQLDLRLIRTELAALGLDWDQPAFVADAIPAASACNVEVDLGEIGIRWQTDRMFDKANELSESLKINEAVTVLREILDLEPDQANANNLLAWLLVTGPQEMRNPEEAIKCSEQAIRASPDNSSYLNTLGTVCYRAGRWNEASEALNKSTSSGHLPREYNLYLLAMCHAQLGHSTTAREFFLHAESGMQANLAQLTGSARRDLLGFQKEASQTLAECEK